MAAPGDAAARGKGRTLLGLAVGLLIVGLVVLGLFVTRLAADRSARAGGEDLLASPSPEKRLVGLALVAGTRAGPGLLEAALDDPDPAVRLAAALMLARTDASSPRPPEEIALLLEAGRSVADVVEERPAEAADLVGRVRAWAAAAGPR